jgi:hypothetical protein
MLSNWHRILSLIIAISAAVLPPAAGCGADDSASSVGAGKVQVGNQIAGVELSPQPEMAARVGVLAEGVVLDALDGQEIAAE